MNFGNPQLGDRRRTRRLVRSADAILRHPGGSLPQKLRSSAELEALYHLMKRPTVTHQSVLAPHCERTKIRLHAVVGWTARVGCGFRELHRCRRFVVRSAHNRRILLGHGADAPCGLLHAFARTLQPLGEYTLRVSSKRLEQKPKRKGKKKVVQHRGREAVLRVAAAPVLLRVPSSKKGEHSNEPLP